MDKYEFLYLLRKELSFLDPKDLEQTIEHYDSRFDDALKDGKDIDQIILEFGEPSEISNAYKTGFNIKTEDKKETIKKLKGWQIALIIIGLPLIIPFVIFAIVLILSFYLLIWSITLSILLIVLILALTAVASLISSLAFLFSGIFITFIYDLGMCALLSGGCIIAAIGFKYVFKAALNLTKASSQAIKNVIISKRGADNE